jgi:carboxymethylenebutenolidase
MIERRVEVRTRSGQMPTFVCYPERDGPHPVIIFFMDAAGIREELREMVRRMARGGYYVMLPNLYYRSGEEEFGSFLGEEGGPVMKRLLDLMESLSIPMVMADTKSMLAFVDEDKAAAKGPAGCVGYCMSGRYAISAAAEFSDRIAVAASIYGVRLVTDEASSPHRAAGRARGELYFGWAEIDEYAPQEWIEHIRQSMKDGGVEGEVEIYKGAEHGFAFPDRPAYNPEASERHWERLIDLFDRNLAKKAAGPENGD